MDHLPREQTEAVMRLWTMAAPERESYLREILARNSPAFIEARDKPEMLFEAGHTMICYNQRTLDAKWLLAHAAWQAIEAYSGVLACLAFCRQPLRASEMAALPRQALFNAKYRELSDQANALLAVHELAAFQWPQGTPQPGDKPTSKKQMATHDLFFMAIGFTFLHELRHAMLRAENKPYGRHAEEHECDRFAAGLVLAEARAWAKGTKWKPDKVVSKRATAIAVGCFIIAVVTPAWARGGTTDHPPVADRIRNVCLAVELPQNDRYWVCLASFVLALLELEARVPALIEFRGRKDLAVKLAEAL